MNRLNKSLKAARLGRKYNVLITETFDLAEKQCAEHLKKHVDPFMLVVKDNFAVEDLPMTCASKMLANYKSPYTATIVQRLLKRGGCLIGKANLDEFAMGSANIYSHFGPVKNPRTSLDDLNNDFYVAGGSSGGCAVAVSEKMADVSIGSDTGGSTRNPASFNGLVGFKPSYGLVSRYGLVPLANSFDSPSFFTRDVGSCIRFFEYTLGHDSNDCTSLDAPLPQKDDNLSVKDMPRMRLGLPTEFMRDDILEDCKNAWKEASKLLESVGVKFEIVSLPHTKYTVACYHILNQSDVQSNMARYDSLRFGYRAAKSNSFAQQLADSRNSAINDVVRRRIFGGNYFNLQENKGKYFDQAAKIRRLIQMDFDKVFREQGIDALLVPSTNNSAPKLSQIKARSTAENRNDDFFTQSANMCGLPAISVPFGKCSDNMPIGMQIVCPYLSDRKCLALGKILHQLALSK